MPKCCIFDLYGTLIDIRTDEYDPALWQDMAALYAAFGADYASDEMKNRFFALVCEEEAALSAETGYSYPEIDLRTVFQRLYFEAPKTHRHEYPIKDEDAFFVFLANAFRVRSRRRFALYPDTVETLRYLKDHGFRLYLLSNAQKVFTLPEIEVLGLAPFFDTMYFSSEFRVRKPQREFMAILLEKEGLAPDDCVMIGNDFSSDMKIAAEFAMQGVFLNTDGWCEETLLQNVQALYPARVKLIESGKIAELPKLLGI